MRTPREGFEEFLLVVVGQAPLQTSEKRTRCCCCGSIAATRFQGSRQFWIDPERLAMQVFSEVELTC